MLFVRVNASGDDGKMGWRELEVGEVIKEGDEFYPTICEFTGMIYREAGWYPAPKVFWGTRLTLDHVQFRRSATTTYCGENFTRHSP